MVFYGKIFTGDDSTESSNHPLFFATRGQRRPSGLRAGALYAGRSLQGTGLQAGAQAQLSALDDFHRKMPI